MVDSLAVLAGAGGVTMLFSWLAMAIFFRNGFFVSVSACPACGLAKDDAGGLAMDEGGVLFWRGIEGAAGMGGTARDGGSRGNSWLAVGVVS